MNNTNTTMKFNEIKSFKIGKTKESIVYNGKWDKTCGLDVVVEVNGESYEYEYTNLKVRNKLKQIEKYFNTGKGKEKGELYYNNLMKEGWVLHKPVVF